MLAVAMHKGLGVGEKKGSRRSADFSTDKVLLECKAMDIFL